VRFVCGLLLAVGVLTGCGDTEPDPAAVRDELGNAVYADGTYVATYDYASADGWRPYIYVEINAGLARRICFNGVSVDGALMTDDDRYVESTRLERGFDLRSTINLMEACLLNRQTLPISTCVPESEWSVYFVELANAAFQAAERQSSTGHTSGRATRIDVEPLSMAGPYLVSDSPDETGWIAELVATYLDGVITSAEYRETRTDYQGQVAVKREDAAYLGRFSETVDTDYLAVVETLIQQLLSGSPADQIDAISGATMTSSRFASLVAALDRLRKTPDLPRRLCSD
jgi:major membrane immunogen (membrane-anchored lipoprotein)